MTSHWPGTGARQAYDLVLRNGRVMDPETGHDSIGDVAVRGGRIAAVGSGLVGRREVDVGGQVVAPGFVDMHSHAGSIQGQWLQVTDGVTTALELECGAPDVASAYRVREAEGAVVNFGYSASWAGVRMHLLSGAAPDATSHQVLRSLGDLNWRRAAGQPEVAAVRATVEAQLAAGALGVGILLGYAPSVDPREIRSIAALAADAGVPTFTHARPLIEQDPSVVIDGAEELVSLAGETGAHMHYCHINSTSNQHLDRVAALIETARHEGSRVSAESYPYGSGMTVIGAESLHPDRLDAYELVPQDLVYAPTGRRLRNLADLIRLRAADPRGLVFERYYDDTADPTRLAAAVGDPHWAVVSDAMPLTWESACRADHWPIPASARTHPRSAGSFARMLRLTREGTVGLTLMETLTKLTIHPARILEPVASGLRSRARVQVGCHADLVVFDPELVTDRATYTQTTRTSTGITHVLVNGELVVLNGQLRTHVRAGQPIRNSAAP